jgi:tetraacyldisaccharide 4'-kinase
MSLVARFARAMENGAVPPWALARAASAVWGRVASRGVARPLALPDGVRVVAIGGATLGGSGKTPVALAYALSRSSGERVALVGHAYRASPGVARVVMPDDDVAIVGDEALACARAIDARDARNVSVVVAPRRQAAIDFAAARGASIIVLDGVAQTSPRRASLALLAVDADAPWGAGEPPPLGDLRAPSASLIDACDAVIAIRDPLAPAGTALACARPVHVVDIESRGAWREGALVAWSEIARLRVGLVTSIARPSRVVAFLARRGVTPHAIAFFADHQSPRVPATGEEIDLWLATSKCAAHRHARHARHDRALAHIDYTLPCAGNAPFPSLP